MPSFSKLGDGKLGNNRMLEARSGAEKIDENFTKISDMPSRYHRGEDRYMGGQIIYRRSEFSRQTDSMISRISSITGSMRTDVDWPSGADAMKFDKQEIMQISTES